MNIQLRSLYTYTDLFFKGTIQSTVSEQFQKVATLVAIALTAFVAAYLVFRHCSFNAVWVDDNDRPAPTDLLKKIDYYPETAEDYIELGKSLPLDGKVELPDGTELKQEDVFLKAIEIDSESSVAYNCLGTIIDALTKVQLQDGTEKNQQELFLKAYELDPTSSSAVCHLGATLEGGGTLELPNGKQLTREQQFVRVVKKHGAVAHPSRTSIAFTNNPIELTQKELFHLAVELDNGNATAFHNLSFALRPGERIHLPTLGVDMNAVELNYEAIELNPKFAEAYADYGNRIRKNTPPLSFANKSAFTKKQLYLEAIKLDPTDASAYLNLSSVLNYGDTVTLPDGTEMNSHQLLLKAIDLDPYYFGYYVELHTQLEDDDPVTLLDGSSMTPQEIYDMIDDCANKYGIQMSPY